MKELILDAQMLVAAVVSLIVGLLGGRELLLIGREVLQNDYSATSAVRLFMLMVLASLCLVWMAWAALMRVRECDHSLTGESDSCPCRFTRSWLIGWGILRRNEVGNEYESSYRMSETSRRMQIALVLSLCVVFTGLLIHQLTLFGSDEASLKYTFAAALCLGVCIVPLRNLIRQERQRGGNPESEDVESEGSVHE